MPVREPTDGELLAAGDTRSFELFYRRHFEPVLGFFVRRTRDPELAADLTAETFASALSARRRYRPEQGRGDSWLFAIAYTSSRTRVAAARPPTARAGGWGWSASTSRMPISSRSPRSPTSPGR